MGKKLVMCQEILEERAQRKQAEAPAEATQLQRMQNPLLLATHASPLLESMLCARARNASFATCAVATLPCWKAGASGRRLA